jgi:hypothetical protein
MKTWRSGSVAMLGFLAACATVPPEPVSVVGPANGIAQLAGEWSGEYSGAVDDRKGLIYFRLDAATDSAQGEVLMTAAADAAQRPWSTSSPVGLPVVGVLSISFVLAEPGFVSGILQPYFDPASGALLKTTFRGRLENDYIWGTFVTWNERTKVEVSGFWNARRAPAKAARDD